MSPVIIASPFPAGSSVNPTDPRYIPIEDYVRFLVDRDTACMHGAADAIERNKGKTLQEVWSTTTNRDELWEMYYAINEVHGDEAADAVELYTITDQYESVGNWPSEHDLNVLWGALLRSKYPVAVVYPDYVLGAERGFDETDFE